MIKYDQNYVLGHLVKMKASNRSSRSTRVLQSASKLIVHYGFDKTTMNDIAREAGVSKGALYLEWPGKDQLFDALINFEMQRLLQDLRLRIERDPQGGRISHLYRHTLLALQANPLISAVYTRDNRVLGDFIHRQDIQRYTSRLMLGKEVTGQMQAAGLLRKDIRPEVLTYLFSIIALGFGSIGSLIPPTEIPPLEDISEGLTRMIEQGLSGGSEDSQAGKQAILKMMELMLQQTGE